MSFIVKAENGKEFEYQSRAEADDHVETIRTQFGMDATVEHVAETDGGTASEPGDVQVVDMSEQDAAEEVSESIEAIDKVKQSGLDTDPLSVLPGFMVDSIQGAQAVNKRGYAMIAERYGIAVTTEMINSPWDNEEGRVVMKATAITEDGREYNAYGTACASDGDDKANLIELADTRSQKRAIQWASGYGIVGYQELTGQLEGEQ